MSEPRPFSAESIGAQIRTALSQSAVPPGKTFALVGLATTDGMRGVIAIKAGSHWEFHAEADLHGHEVSAGGGVIASW